MNDSLWFVLRGSTPQGPYKLADLKRLVSQGRLDGSTKVRTGDSSPWISLDLASSTIPPEPKPEIEIDFRDEHKPVYKKPTDDLSPEGLLALMSISAQSAMRIAAWSFWLRNASIFISSIGGIAMIVLMLFGHSFAGLMWLFACSSIALILIVLSCFFSMTSGVSVAVLINSCRSLGLPLVIKKLGK